MGIRGLEDEVRTPIWATIGLGFKMQGKNGDYPQDCDAFVVHHQDTKGPKRVSGESENAIVDQIVAAYSGRKISEAAGSYWAIGKALRGCLSWPADHRDRHGREVVFETMNRSWSKSALRCVGDGGNGGADVGEAVCLDDAYLAAFKRAGLVLGAAPGKGHRITCKGPECPMWISQRVAGSNTLPGCHREMRFHFQLLHPTTDVNDPNYNRELGWVRVVSSSFNGIVDIQSGLRLLKLKGGRDYAIPFTLRRLAKTISTPEGRALKHCLIVTFDQAEVEEAGLQDPRWAMLPPARQRYLLAQEAPMKAAFLQDQEAKQVRALPQLEAAAAPPTYDQVAEIQPQVADSISNDRDDAIEEALSRASEEPDGETIEQAPESSAIRRLERSEIDALKQKCGGVPGQRETLAKAHALRLAAYREIGLLNTGGEFTPWNLLDPESQARAERQFEFLTTAHRAWIEDRLREEMAEKSEVA